MKSIAIYGSGGLGREVLDLVLTINKSQPCYKEIVFIDDTKPQGELINGFMTYPFSDFIKKYSVSEIEVAIALGEPRHRIALREKVQQHGYSLATLIHPTAFIGTDTVIGEGTIIQYAAFISCNVTIGSNVYIQLHVDVGHDTIIGCDSVISPKVNISGNCRIGDRTYIGLSVPIKEQVIIGSDTIVGMGALVIRDIPDNVIAFGNPARVIKENTEGRVFKNS
jgi:sugar O-acyltransferase (sialic acid O-acetyltransferase NeuD family)